MRPSDPPGNVSFSWVARFGGRILLAASLATVLGCGATPAVEPSPAGLADDPLDDRQTAAFLAEHARSSSFGDAHETSARIARIQALGLRAEAWPRLASGEPDDLVDDVAGTPQVVVHDSMRPPWSFIFRLTDGVPEVAAIGIAGIDAPAGPHDITVLTYPTSVPLTRASFRQFIEGAERVGIGVVQREAEFTLFRFEAPVRAAYLWVRVTSSRAGEPLAMSEVSAYTPGQLEHLESGLPDWVRLVPLQAVDTAPWQGIDLVGLPDLGSGQPPQAREQDAEGVIESIDRGHDGEGEDDDGAREPNDEEGPEPPSEDTPFERPAVDRPEPEPREVP